MQDALAYFGGGSFRVLEAVFARIPGLTRITPGHTGGQLPNPQPAQIALGTTGHIEVVELAYPPAAVAYADLLAAFFLCHDPTSRDRQGGDEGPQYRSAIFFTTPAQQEEAAGFLRGLEMAGIYPSRIVTELRPAAIFWPAPPADANFFERFPDDPYSLRVIAPAVDRINQRLLPRLAGTGA